jgi:hypothetical protein
MLYIILSMLIFNPVNGIKIAGGLATIYYPKDGYCGSEKADGTAFTEKDKHIAHRRIPLGTKGMLCNVRTNKCVYTTIQDRGPFGSIKSCSKKHVGVTHSSKAKQITWNNGCYLWEAQIKLKKGWQYRGDFDLTKSVAKAIDHQSFDKVIFIYSKTSKRTHNKPELVMNNITSKLKSEREI